MSDYLVYTGQITKGFLIFDKNGACLVCLTFGTENNVYRFASTSQKATDWMMQTFPSMMFLSEDNVVFEDADIVLLRMMTEAMPR